MRRKTISAVVIVVIAAIIVVSFFLSQTVVINYVTYTVSAEDQQNLIDYLSGDTSRVAVRSPTSTTWESFESGSFLLGIKNNDAQERTFYVNVYLESLGGALSSSSVAQMSSETTSWLTYENSVDVAANNYVLEDIKVNPGIDAPAGTYALRIAVCGSNSDANCHIQSADYTEASLSLYGNAQISFEIKP